MAARKFQGLDAAASGSGVCRSCRWTRVSSWLRSARGESPNVRWHGQLAYLTGQLPDGNALPLMRLQYTGGHRTNPGPDDRTRIRAAMGRIHHEGALAGNLIHAAHAAC